MRVGIHKRGRSLAKKTMFTLEVPLPLPLRLPTPWKPRVMKNPYGQLPQKTWRIQAEPKGFNGKAYSSAKVSAESKLQRKEENGDEKISDVVMGRMIKRIVLNTVVPLGIGLALLQVLSVVNDGNLWKVPRWLPFLTTFITFGASALGIAYGTLSTSWDEDNKGSFLGFEEVKKNWAEMWTEVDDD